jgi:hypothetical protein
MIPFGVVMKKYAYGYSVVSENHYKLELERWGW